MRYYNITKVANKILIENPKIRETESFDDVDFRQHEITMSCDSYEAMCWMKHFMQEALITGANNNNEYDYSLREMFLAAYDTFIALGGNDDLIIKV